MSGISDKSSEETYTLLDFSELEKKFLYRHTLSPHVGSRGALMYYTSQVGVYVCMQLLKYMNANMD